MRRTKEEYRKFLRSDRWAKIRADALMLADFKCEECGDRRGLQVHHLDYAQDWGEEEPESLIVLCRQCHMIAHGMRVKTKPRRKKRKLKNISQGRKKFKYRDSDVISLFRRFGYAGGANALRKKYGENPFRKKYKARRWGKRLVKKMQLNVFNKKRS